MQNAPTVAVDKLSTRFDWRAVSVSTSRALLLAAYAHDQDLVRRVDALSSDQMAAQLRSVYGSPPQAAMLGHWDAWEVLRTQWALKEASKEQLATLVSYAMASLPVAEQIDARSTLANLRHFTRSRRLTSAFKTNLRAAFVRAHKRAMPVSGGRHAKGSSPKRPVCLQGKAEPPDNHPYPHKLEARPALDGLMGSGSIDQRSGLIVLPTGAGKTSTVVDWLVPRMASDTSLRVLWLAHQHELLEQARRAFEAAAAHQDEAFDRKLRLISSAGSPTSMLAERDLDVALVTWQSLNHGWAQKRELVRRYLSRPTVVVVDEAHHAAAPAYQRILADVRKRPQVAAVVGLTATPWPTQEGAARRLRKTFPVAVLTRTPEEMHGQGILARPVFHTVDTGQHLKLTAAELAQSRGDLAPRVLTRLVNDGRDDLLVRTWTDAPGRWGKTLVFATSRDHADRLGEKLDVAGVRVKVVHSTSVVPFSEALAWFSKIKRPAVLVSVGMLTEGVDIPDARTAFLARPTTSRVLMRQMMGRVLRGERAGGEATSHIVYFRDQWLNFDEVLEPGEIVGVGGRVATTPSSGPEYRLPPILDSSGHEIAEDVLAQIRRMYSTRLAALPLAPVTTTTVLAGYYAVDDLNVPVMEHQRDAYQAVVRRALGGKSFTGAPALSMFNSDPPPYPTERAVRAVVNYVRTYDSAPAFVPVKAYVSSVTIARALREAPPMDDSARADWLRDKFESTLARLAYESFEHFEEAVDRDLHEIRGLVHGPRLNPERLEPRRPRKTLPRLIRSTSRPLPTVRSIAAAMQDHLAGEAALARLDLRNLPELGWTARMGSRNWPAAWAYWAMKNTGRLKGQGVIRVHRALRTPRSQVSDEALEFLVFHEMLHHLLPGQGHNPEFRRLERLWPGADDIDVELDTLHERYRLPTPPE